MKKYMSLKRGFTLIEVVLAIAVGLIIIAGVSVGYSYMKRAAVTDNQRNDAAAIVPQTNSTATTSSTGHIVPTPKPVPPNPVPTTKSGIQGSISIGPTCPVMRDPPDPSCADKPYQATIIVKTADGQREITRFTSNKDGTFKVNLAPGTYLLVPMNTSIYPRGESQKVTVASNTFTKVTISFDSGIR